MLLDFVGVGLSWWVGVCIWDV